MITVVQLGKGDEVLSASYDDAYWAAVRRLTVEGLEVRVEAVGMPGEREGWLCIKRGAAMPDGGFWLESSWLEEPADMVGLIEALAASDPYQAWYPGSTKTCRHCGEPQPFNGEKPGQHRRDCIWRQAHGWVERRDAKRSVESP